MAKGGRKIYRTSANYRKKRNRKILKAFLVIILLAALVFLGYSVAKPIHNYIVNKTWENATDEEVWTPPVVTEQTGSETESDTQISEETENADKENNPKAESFSAYKLPVTALVSSQALTAELDTAKENGYTAICVPLKAEGGKIYYNTASAMAATSEDAVAGTMYAGQISSIIKNKGFIAVAYINLLEDNNRYGGNRTGSYRTTDDSTWLDNAPANGGKPWLSPFETDTQEFVRFISNEITGAGFDNIVFDGAVFPNFRNSDKAYIGESVQSETRYEALVNIANIAAEAAEAYEINAILTVSAADILDGTEEVFKPTELKYSTFAVDFSLENIPATAVINGEETALSELSAYDRAYVIFSEIQRLAGADSKLVPVLTQSEFTQADFNETITAVRTLGCESYIIS